MDQPRLVEREKQFYFITSFLSAVTLSYYVARLAGGGTPVWSVMYMIPLLVVAFWVFYPRVKRKPATFFMMNAAFAFLSLISVFLLFQFLSALRG